MQVLAVFLQSHHRGKGVTPLLQQVLAVTGSPISTRS